MFTQREPKLPIRLIGPWQALLAGSILLASTATAQTAPAVAEAPADQLTLEAAVDIALGQNRQLAVLGAELSALESTPPQAGALPDPMLSLNAMNLPTDTFNLDQEPMTQVQVALSQQIPFPGKRKLRRAAAEHEVRAGAARLAEQGDALVGAVRGAWWQLFQIDRALDIVTQNQNLLRDFVQIAEAKYAVGNGLQQDVLLAQLEQSRLKDRELRLRGQRDGAQASLNALLDQPANQPVTLAPTPPSVALPELPATAALLAGASASRDLLLARQQLVEAADARLALARRERYPDLRLGAGYGFRQGQDPLRGPRPDLFSVALSVNLPLYHASKQGKAIEQRASERAQREYGLQAAARAVEAEIARHHADYQAAREQVLLLETAIIPQAQQTVASMLAGYQVNEVDFLNVVNGQLTLYNAQISYWEALSAAKRSLAGLAAAVGREALYE